MVKKLTHIWGIIFESEPEIYNSQTLGIFLN